MKKIGLLLVVIAFASFVGVCMADYADIANELQRRTLLAECSRAPKIGAMVKAHCVGLADVSGVTNRVYTGAAITFDPVVKLGSTTLTKSTHYTQTFTNNTNVGKATVKLTATGAGGYFGSLTKAFEITPYPLSDSMVSNITAQAYTGSAVKPLPSVVFNGSLLSTNTDYTVSWENNVEKGSNAVVVVTGKGNFGGVARKKFTITQ